jgi:hypothetical protein
MAQRFLRRRKRERLAARDGARACRRGHCSLEGSLVVARVLATTPHSSVFSKCFPIY